MAYTNTWDNAAPLGTVPANTIDNIFRSIKLDLTERLDDIFAMPTFVTDPLRPYGLKFTDAQDAVISLGDNAGTPRNIIIKDKTGAATYATHKYTGITLSPPTLTGASTPFISVTQTWNNAATTFTGILVNITSTASAAASLFVDYQLAGTSKFSITKAGAVAIPGNILTLGGNPATTGIIRLTAGFTIYGRNSGNTADILVLSMPTDEIWLGDSAANIRAAGQFALSHTATGATGTDIWLGKGTQATVGAAGGASALPATPEGYLTWYRGSTKIVVPYYLG